MENLFCLGNIAYVWLYVFISEKKKKYLEAWYCKMQQSGTLAHAKIVILKKSKKDVKNIKIAYHNFI